MKPLNPDEAPNKTLALLRRLALEKRETKRQMRESFKTDPEIQRVIKELDQHNVARKTQAV